MAAWLALAFLLIPAVVLVVLQLARDEQRTEGMSRKARRGICFLLYSAPSLYSVIGRVFLHRAGEIRTVLLVDYGGLVLAFSFFAAVLPAVLRASGRSERAQLWRRAAWSGLPMGILYTSVWTILALPAGAPVSGTVLAGWIIACGAAILTLWWVDKRWLHYGMFENG